jgi:hypothetical protein
MPDMTHRRKVLITAVGAAGIGLVTVHWFNLLILFVVDPYFLNLLAALIFIPPLIVVLVTMRRPNEDREAK